jgi:hypothetical protein
MSITKLLYFELYECIWNLWTVAVSIHGWKLTHRRSRLQHLICLDLGAIHNSNKKLLYFRKQLFKLNFNCTVVFLG